MRYIFVFITLLLIKIDLKAQSDNAIVEFSPSQYAEWEYSRSGFILNEANIIQYKVVLYKPSSTKNYTLTSPLIDLTAMDCITVEFDWKANNYDQSSYNPAKGSPQIELLDEQDNVITTKSYLLTEAMLIQTITVPITLPTLGPTKYRIRISAPKADVDNTGAIKTLKIFPENKGSVSSNLVSNHKIKIEKNEVVIENIESKSIQITQISTGRVLYFTSKSAENVARIILPVVGAYVITINSTHSKILINTTE